MEKLYDIKVMTLYEYEARMHAYKLKQVDEAETMHKQAWLDHQVTATRAKGKNGQEYVYGTFKQFFDTEKYMNEVLGVSTQAPKQTRRTKTMVEMARRANER